PSYAYTKRVIWTRTAQQLDSGVRAMRRWLVCLTFLAIALGCAVARRAAPEDDTGGTTHPELLPNPDVVSADLTKRHELPLPNVEPVALDSAGMVELAKTDPVAFLTHVVERYDKEVKGYTCKLEKQERVKGKLRDVEVVKCYFREKPF